MMRLALGTAQFGFDYGVANSNGQVLQENAKEIIEYCKLEGIVMLDTAVDYGLSERCLGQVGVEDFDIVTKLPSIPEHSTDIETWIIREVSASMSHLNVKRLYALMLHRPEQLLGPNGERILRSLDKLKAIGLVKKIGISAYSPEEIEIIFNMYRFDIVQAPFNLLDQRLVNTGCLNKLSANGVEVHTRSSFLQGLLLLPRDAIPNKFKAWNFLWDSWHDWLIKNNISAVEGCLAFVLTYSKINKVVVGVDTRDQLKEIVRSTLLPSRGITFPDISCSDTDLVNPMNWNKL